MRIYRALLELYGVRESLPRGPICTAIMGGFRDHDTTGVYVDPLCFEFGVLLGSNNVGFRAWVSVPWAPG